MALFIRSPPLQLRMKGAALRTASSFFPLE
jgi:hypothetical protein